MRKDGQQSSSPASGHARRVGLLEGMRRDPGDYPSDEIRLGGGDDSTEPCRVTARATVVTAPVKSKVQPCGRQANPTPPPSFGETADQTRETLPKTGSAVNQLSPEGMARRGQFTGLRRPAA